MKKIELAIYLTNLNGFKYWEPKFKRVYFGNEFCEKLIPSREELKEVLDFADKKKMGFSLLTCQVSDFFLKKIYNLFSVLRKKDEIVVNDWGIFNIISKDFKKMLPNCIFGKFLINNISILSEPIQEFLKKWGFVRKRFEMEIFSFTRFPPLSFSREPIIKNYPGLKISLYYPYSYITTARFCPYLDYKDKRFQKPDFVCPKPCQKYTFVADHPIKKGGKLFLKGNTWFIKQVGPSISRMRRDFPNIDRLVYMPTIPI